MERARGIGLHTMGTLVKCDHNMLLNYDEIFNFLKNFPKEINMTLIEINNNPILYSCYSEKNFKNYGLSGFSLLHESHISLHTWPYENTMDFDVFSCYTFNYNYVLKKFKDFFKGDLTNVSIINRGDITQLYEI